MNVLAQAAAAEGTTVLAGVVATVVGALQFVVLFVLRWMRAAQVSLQTRVVHLETEVKSCHEERFKLSTELGNLKGTLGRLTGET